MKLINFVRLLILAFGCYQGTVLAFPDTARHGYVNCGVCHVSMAGGGTLTPYGRALSAEFMSTWANETEGQPFHGAVESLPESLLVGGGLRTVQTYTDTPKVRQGRYFLMQSDVELGWATEAYTVLASFGRDINSPDSHKDDEWVSARHFVGFGINDNVSIRLGKFMKAYGLTIPNHTAQIKRGLGWSEFSETYNAEVNFFAESYVVSVTGIGGRPDDDDEDSEKGFALTGHFLSLNPNLRIGASFYLGRNEDKTERKIFGPDFVFAPNKRTYLMGEYDLVQIAPKEGESLQGFVTYTQFGYELLKGLDITLTHEAKKNDREEDQLAFSGYGPGIRFSPRPHLILTGEWQKQKTPQFNKTIDSAWMVMQYWL